MVERRARAGLSESVGQKQPSLGAALGERYRSTRCCWSRTRFGLEYRLTCPTPARTRESTPRRQPSAPSKRLPAALGRDGDGDFVQLACAPTDFPLGTGA